MSLLILALKSSVKMNCLTFYNRNANSSAIDLRKQIKIIGNTPTTLDKHGPRRFANKINILSHNNLYYKCSLFSDNVFTKYSIDAVQFINGNLFCKFWIVPEMTISVLSDKSDGNIRHLYTVDYEQTPMRMSVSCVRFLYVSRQIIIYRLTFCFILCIVYVV